MKKLLLLPLILVGLLGCSNNVPYTVDTPIHELNGLSLNDLFKDSASKLGDDNLVVGGYVGEHNLNNTYYKYGGGLSSIDNYYFSVSKNLLPDTFLNQGEYTYNGITINITGNNIDIVGTATGNAYIFLTDGFRETSYGASHLVLTSTIVPNLTDTFTFSVNNLVGTPLTSSSNIRSSTANGVFDNHLVLITTSTNTITNGEIYGLRLMINSGITVEANFDLQLEVGSLATPYEDFIPPQYLFNITDFKSKQPYSPIYKTTLNNLNNNQIQVQMDSWINTGLSTDIWFYDDLLNIYNDLTLSQLVRFYDDYITLSRVPLSSQTTFSRDDIIILVIALILYLGGMFLAVKTNTQWLIIISGLLWFIPIYIIPNIFIIIFSITMMIFSFIVSYTKREE
jgi:hypothetical protein